MAETFLSRTAKQPVAFRDEGLKASTLEAALGPAPKKGTFDAAEADATAQLTEVFLGRFPASAQFASVKEEVEELALRLTRIDRLTDSVVSAGGVATPPSGGLEALSITELSGGDDDDEAATAASGGADALPPAAP